MKFYVTTPIYYVNAEPHIGHTYTTVAADTLARFYRMSGHDVFFLTGTDEHGQKIYDAAKKQGLAPKELVDKNSAIYKNLWQDLNISYSRFIRTSEPEHAEVIKRVFTRLMDSGDLYKSEYTGCYCIDCETFLIPERGQEKPLCPDCTRPIREISESSYFFRISAYAERLAHHIEKSAFVKPDFRKNEVLNFIGKGLCDVSVTRQNVDWGIPSPTPEKYTVYVWFDALLNYLSGIGYMTDTNLFQKFWPADVQFIGKDIIRFHHIIWPSLLLALGLPLPKTIFAHGWWLLGKGNKISKSKGNAVSPGDLIAEYGVDPFRFFLLREVTFGLDGEYSEEAFKKRYNSDLVNDLGNLVNRTVNLVEQKLGGRLPSATADGEITALSRSVAAEYAENMRKLSFSEALRELWKLVSFLNRYLDGKAPWRENSPDRKMVLYSVMLGIRDVSVLVAPFIPGTASRIWKILGLKDSPEESGFSTIGTKLPENITTNRKEILFPRKK